MRYREIAKGDPAWKTLDPEHSRRAGGDPKWQRERLWLKYSRRQVETGMADPLRHMFQ